MRLLLPLQSLVIFVWCEADGGDEKTEEHAPYDGWYNNLLHPDWGAVDTQILRRSPPQYSDGVYAMAGDGRPNPFLISEAAHRGESGLNSARNRTAMLVYFGQQIVEEIIDAQRPGCPREFENIPVPSGHRYNPENKTDLSQPFLRTRYDARTGYSSSNPRQQLNEITPYLDGQVIYGPSKAWTDAIREFRGGRLLARNTSSPISESFPALNNISLPYANPPPPRDHYLKPVSRFYRLGNPRAFENPFLLSFGVMWFRWHNWLAADLLKNNSNWDDERLFHEARKRVIAHHQKIVFYDWLPRWLSVKENFRLYNMGQHFYRGYNPHVHPGITQEFQVAAMRYGHTLVTPGLWRLKPRSDGGCDILSSKVNTGERKMDVQAVRLCNTFFNAQEYVEEDLDSLFVGMSSTLAEKEDNIIIDDLRGDLFGPLEFSRRDLAAINIQRGRDHGVADYNTVRETYGLPRRKKWKEINKDTAMQKGPIVELKKLYGNPESPDDVDLFTGGLLETTSDGPGRLFKKIMIDQFIRIRDGDRFWYENTDNGLFTKNGVEEINSTTLRSIITKVTRIKPRQIQSDVFLYREGDDGCPQPVPLNTSATFQNKRIFEDCTPLEHFDYFENSRVSFAVTFLICGLCLPVTILIMWLMAQHRQKQIEKARQQIPQRHKNTDPNTFYVLEWVGPKEIDRNVLVSFDQRRYKIHVLDGRNIPLRMIDLRCTETRRIGPVNLWISNDRLQNVLSVKVDGEIDLVLKFVDTATRSDFQKRLGNFLKNIGVHITHRNFAEHVIYNTADTKAQRQVLLDKFLRVIFLQTFPQNANVADESLVDKDVGTRITQIQLTRTEFADILGLKINSIFVRNMFLMIDVDHDGFVSFQEFLDMFIVLSSDDAEQKARLFFNMYDIRRNGILNRQEFATLISSLLDLSGSSMESEQMKPLISTMYQQAGVREGTDMTFDDFKKIFSSSEYAEALEGATLQLETVGDVPKGSAKTKRGKSMRARRNTFVKRYRTTDYSRQQGVNTLRQASLVTATSTAYPQTKFQQWLLDVTEVLENNRLQIFWATLYTLVLTGIFIERAYYFSVEREHSGLRRLAGDGVTLTRGAASAMMFTYSSLLVTMSRNTVTFLRETFLNRFIPFDSNVAMHLYIAYWALFYTVVHVVGHSINLYHVCTWASTDLNCQFREFFRATHVLASFHYWAWTTITGVTGIILTIIIIVMYVFAIPYARRHVFIAFWKTHLLYIFVYIFLVLHGIGRLVQPPLTQWFLLGPAILFVIDKCVSFSRRKIEITVLKAELLPSGVTAVVLKRPSNFEYKSGQWVRVACKDLGQHEYHPFTLTSAPHDPNLSLHIRAVGPWTTNFRRLYTPGHLERKALPKLFLDGPYGEGHQDWFRFDVSILVGGGIGVTPFASILKDIAHNFQHMKRFQCKKVYFLWVTQTQKHYEWFTDWIREVEAMDQNNFVNVDIFITQFQQKFDLRTTMVYICERHFQKIAGMSLFTGLRATTHFGRPNFQDFMENLHVFHPEVEKFGVFSCGPPPMTRDVQRATSTMNKMEGPVFIHHYENF